MALTNFRLAGAAGLLLFAAVQVVIVGGIQTDTGTTARPTESTSTPSALHGIEKRSVSILARNGDLPYFRKEWNKKLHPGFRGMNVENKDDTSVPSKRYVGALARGGGFPVGSGKRAVNQYNSIASILPEEAILEAYLADEMRQRLLQRELAAESENMNVATEGGMEEDPEATEELAEKRGGVGSLARGGYMPSEGRYTSGKRSVAALARSGELLSIGRGSSQEKDGGNGSTKRGLGSILRNGGIPTIGKVPVTTVGSPSNGKRGIESLARNYALPSMINEQYEKKYELIDNEDVDSGSSQMAEPYYGEFAPVDEREDATGMNVQGDQIKRHLGSFARTYGLRPSSKRNLGSIVRNGGAMYYNGKRNGGGVPDYDGDYLINDKRYFASLLKNQAGYLPVKRYNEEEDTFGDADKRHLASILHDRNAFISGKRYVGSIARQGLLGGRHDKRETLDEVFDDGQWNRGDYNVGKRSIADDESGTMKGELSFDQQDGSSASNGTAEDELKNAAAPRSNVPMKKRSKDGDGGNLEGKSFEKEKNKNERSSSTHRQRRSLAVPYSTSDEYPMPVLQNTDFYDLETTDEDEITGEPGKRFMGSLARWGWFPRQFRRGASRDEGGGGASVKGWDDQSWATPVTFQIHKRHIGALARLGWLPAIRSQRRYSRGLGKRSVEEDGGGREDTAHGTQPAPNRFPIPVTYTSEAPISLIGGPDVGWPRDETVPLEDATSAGVEFGDGWRIGEEEEESFGEILPKVLTEKRYLLLPAMDHLLLRKLYPRQMLPLLV